MSDKVISSTTQEFLDVYDIVNDMVLLKDGSAAIILQVGTMNFSLLAEQEQDAVIFTYGSVLNSLNYPIQINIQSQTKDATKYLRLLDEQIAKSSSERKAALIKQYRGFVESLIKERNVLQKRFYITTAATPGEMGLLTAGSLLPGQSTFNIESVEKSILLEKANNILEPRRDHLTAQFNRLGLFSRQLTTQEIIQNFYINYNPEAAEGQEISSSENYTTPLVRASFGGKFMQLNNIMQNQAAAVGQVQQTQPGSISATQEAPLAAQPTTQEAPPLQSPPPLAQSQTVSPQDPTPPEQSALPPAQGEPAELMEKAEEQILNQAAEQSVDQVVEQAAEQVSPINQVFPPPTSIDQNLAVNLDLKLDPNLITNSVQENQVDGGLAQINEVFGESSIDTSPQLNTAETISQPVEQVAQPEIPTVETAPIIDLNSTPASDPATQADLAAPEPAPQTEPVVATELDFAEEITPLQIQDDTKNV